MILRCLAHGQRRRHDRCESAGCLAQRTMAHLTPPLRDSGLVDLKPIEFRIRPGSLRLRGDQPNRNGLAVHGMTADDDPVHAVGLIVRRVRISLPDDSQDALSRGVCSAEVAADGGAVLQVIEVEPVPDTVSQIAICAPGLHKGFFVEQHDQPGKFIVPRRRKLHRGTDIEIAPRRGGCQDVGWQSTNITACGYVDAQPAGRRRQRPIGIVLPQPFPADAGRNLAVELFTDGIRELRRICRLFV